MKQKAQKRKMKNKKKQSKYGGKGYQVFNGIPGLSNGEDDENRFYETFKHHGKYEDDYDEEDYDSEYDDEDEEEDNLLGLIQFPSEATEKVVKTPPKSQETEFVTSSGRTYALLDWESSDLTQARSAYGGVPAYEQPQD